MTLTQATICKGCWERMRLPIPLRGVLSTPFRAFGIHRSRINPNLCTMCELNFSTVMRARKVTIDATVMFADLRNYTGLSQSLSTDAITGLLDAFYDACADAIWEQDGLLNKTIGDAVMAVFNFPVTRADHARRALLAARAIQQRCYDRQAGLAETFGITDAEFGVGVGIHTGMLDFGEFGRSHRDYTAIGTVVNIASRAQSVAAPGQILVTRAVYESARQDMPNSRAQPYTLKGFADKMELFAA